MSNFIVVRHGESVWNKKNKFTGWCDVDLSKDGKKEAKKIGKILKSKEFNFHHAYTSLLKRSIHTLWIILKELNQSWIKIDKSWRLNERHYGALQGLNKDEITKKYGEKTVKIWRRSYSNPPPLIEDPLKNKFSGYDRRYENIKKFKFPHGESLKMTLKRVFPFWKNFIHPEIKKEKKNIILVAHGNSIRALKKIIENLDEHEISNMEIPNTIPFLYKFKKGKLFKIHGYLNF